METEIDRLCRLSKISLAQEEKERLSRDMREILDWVKQLEEKRFPEAHTRRITEEFRSDRAEAKDPAAIKRNFAGSLGKA